MLSQSAPPDPPLCANKPADNSQSSDQDLVIESTSQARLVQVTGRVQGVWFRASLQDVAKRLGIMGWCRNTAQGSVEALVLGPLSAINLFLDWCQQGSPLSRVDRVEVLDLALDDPRLRDLSNHFEVRR